MRIDNLQHANWSETILRRMRAGGVDQPDGVVKAFGSGSTSGPSITNRLARSPRNAVALVQSAR
ncbi:hypothetical protein [Yoonia sp.]|uniref:hypothetical protein n=1 Tax=Yoonia sp. TaxID=2212373 RepID=UPI0025F61960|nr:hypothetical protein [Yoonia sp.]